MRSQYKLDMNTALFMVILVIMIKNIHCNAEKDSGKILKNDMNLTCANGFYGKDMPGSTLKKLDTLDKGFYAYIKKLCQNGDDYEHYCSQLGFDLGYKVFSCANAEIDKAIINMCGFTNSQSHPKQLFTDYFWFTAQTLPKGFETTQIYQDKVNKDFRLQVVKKKC